MNKGTIKILLDFENTDHAYIEDSNGFCLQNLCDIEEDINDPELKDDWIKYDGKIIIVTPKYEESWEEPGAIPSEPVHFKGYWHYENIVEVQSK
jgi:hypothetical protein